LPAFDQGLLVDRRVLSRLLTAERLDRASARIAWQLLSRAGIALTVTTTWELTAQSRTRGIDRK